MKHMYAALLTGSLSAMPFYVLAQNAPTNLLLPQSSAIPQTDDDLDGVEDLSDDENVQPRVIFSTPIRGSNDLDDLSNADGRSEGLDQDGTINAGQNIDGPADLNAGQNRNTFGRNGLIPSNNQGNVAGNPRAQRADAVGIIGPDGSITPLANSRAVPVQSGTVLSQGDPFAPLGIRLGSFTLLPTLTQTLGATSNADFAANGQSSAFSQTDVRVTAVSNWALHELRGEIGGSYQKFFNGTSEDLPTFDANLRLRLDHTGEITTTLGANFDLATESAVSNNLTVPPPLFVTDRPNRYQYGGFGEVAKQTGRWNKRLRGTITRQDFESARLSDSSTLSQNDRNNTLFEVSARVGYETSPAIQPFAEGTIGWRVYDEATDSNGNQRDSTSFSLRGGLAFDRGEKLNGEIALGYATEQFDDAALNDLNGLTFDATVNWSPRQFTTVSATAQTVFAESTNLNESGSLTYAASLGIVHDVRPNLSLNASVLASIRDFDGSNRRDDTLQLAAGAEWRLNRSMAIISTVGYDRVESTDAASSYDALFGRLGLRLQR